MINRIVVLSSLVLAFAVSINWVMEQSEVPGPPSGRNDPDLYMLNAEINQFDDTGHLQHTLSAVRFTHFPLTDLTTMKTPTLSLKVTEGSPWQITSREGRILPSSNYRDEVVELWDSVLAEQSGRNGRFMNIQTDSLTVYPDREYAETDEKVYIDNQAGRTTAAGMKAFLDKGRFMFYSTPKDRVITIFLPTPEPTGSLVPARETEISRR